MTEITHGLESRGRFVFGPGDVEDAKGEAALDRYTIEEVTLSDRALFDAAFGALEAEFGPRGELERRDVVSSWLRAPEPRTYHLLAARDADGRVAAVRDCHVRVDARAKAVVVYLAHVLVLPEHRRSGVASLMRAAPLALGRRAAVAAAAGFDLLLAAEMEPALLYEPPTLVRLVAYGKVGFSAIDPARLPYCQPDFRDLARLPDEKTRPVPLIAIVRWVGHERARSVPKRLAQAYLENLYAVFATHCRDSDLRELREHSLRVLAEEPAPEALSVEPHHVPLLALPETTTDDERIRPLLRDRVLAYQLPAVTAAG